MNLVKFPAVKGAQGSYIYPEGAWGRTVKIGGDIVGEYTGSENLTPYTGEWPIPEDPGYATVVSNWEFEALFLDSEYEAIEAAKGTSTPLRRLWNRLMTAPTIDVELPMVKDGVNSLVGTILTQERADTILKGKPL